MAREYIVVKCCKCSSNAVEWDGRKNYCLRHSPASKEAQKEIEAERKRQEKVEKGAQKQSQKSARR